MKKFLALLLTATMCLGVMTGCSGKPTAESLLTSADKKVEAAKSLESNMTMDMGASVSVMGMNIEMGISADLDIEETVDPEVAHVKGDMTLDIPFLANLGAMFGGEDSDVDTKTTVDVETYAEKDGKKYVVYSKQEDGTWTYEETDEMDLATDLNIYAYALENLKDFTLAEETEEFDGKDAYVVSGTLTGEALADTMESMMGEEEDALGASEVDWSKLSFDVDCYFDARTKEPLGTSMSLTEAYSETTTEDGTSVEMSIDKMDLTLTYDKFDGLDELEVPKDIKDSAVEGSALDIPVFPEETETSTDFPTFPEETESNEILNPDNPDPSMFPDVTEGNFTSVDLFNGVTVNGIDYEFPFSISKLLDEGYVIDTDYVTDILEEENLAPDSDEFIPLEKGNEYFRVYVVNDTDEAIPFEEATVYGFSLYEDELEGTVAFNGLHFGDSMQDVLDVMGQPNSVYYGTYHVTLDYYTEDYDCTVSVEIDTETGGLDSLYLTNESFD